MVHNVRTKYRQKGRTQILDLLQDAPRSGRPPKFDSRVATNVTMIACSAPPPGRGRWTLRLIAGQGGTMSGNRRHFVRRGPAVAKKSQLKPWLSEHWCIGEIPGDYLWHREDVL